MLKITCSRYDWERRVHTSVGVREERAGGSEHQGVHSVQHDQDSVHEEKFLHDVCHQCFGGQEVIGGDIGEDCKSVKRRNTIFTRIIYEKTVT